MLPGYRRPNFCYLIAAAPFPRAVRFSGLAEKEAKSALGAEDASPDGFGHAGKLQAAQEHQGRVPQAREHCRPFADAAGVLAQGHVPHIVQPVLDSPVTP